MGAKKLKMNHQCSITGLTPKKEKKTNLILTTSVSKRMMITPKSKEKDYLVLIIQNLKYCVIGTTLQGIT